MRAGAIATPRHRVYTCGNSTAPSSPGLSGRAASCETVNLGQCVALSLRINRLEFEVNSIHHQAIAEPSPKGRIVAWAPDGTPEALEFGGKPFFIGVQWHPEQMGTMPQLFEAFVDAAR